MSESGLSHRDWVKSTRRSASKGSLTPWRDAGLLPGPSHGQCRRTRGFLGLGNPFRNEMSALRGMFCNYCSQSAGRYRQPVAEMALSRGIRRTSIADRLQDEDPRVSARAVAIVDVNILQISIVYLVALGPDQTKLAAETTLKWTGALRCVRKPERVPSTSTCPETPRELHLPPRSNKQPGALQLPTNHYGMCGFSIIGDLVLNCFNVPRVGHACDLD